MSMIEKKKEYHKKKQAEPPKGIHKVVSQSIRPSLCLSSDQQHIGKQNKSSFEFHFFIDCVGIKFPNGSKGRSLTHNQCVCKHTHKCAHTHTHCRIRVIYLPLSFSSRWNSHNMGAQKKPNHNFSLNRFIILVRKMFSDWILHLHDGKSH